MSRRLCLLATLAAAAAAGYSDFKEITVILKGCKGIDKGCVLFDGVMSNEQYGEFVQFGHTHIKNGHVELTMSDFKISDLKGLKYKSVIDGLTEAEAGSIDDWDWNDFEYWIHDLSFFGYYDLQHDCSKEAGVAEDADGIEWNLSDFEMKMVGLGVKACTTHQPTPFPWAEAYALAYSAFDSRRAASSAVGALDGAPDDVFDDGGLDGEGTTLYVMDSGVACAHSEFAGGRCTGILGYQWDVGSVDGVLPLNHCPKPEPVCEVWFYPPPTGARESCWSSWWWDPSVGSHGTHVASTAVGATLGVAPKASIVSVQVLESCGGWGSSFYQMKGLDAIIRHKKQHGVERAVVVASIGGPRDDFMNQFYAKAMREHDLLIVSAAGNDWGTNAVVITPASEETLLTVGALEPASSLFPYKRAWFSNTGDVVDVWATGVNVKGAVIVNATTTMKMDGTSMAAPLVAGVALQLRQRHPELSAMEIKEKLLCIAEQKDVLDVSPYSSISSSAVVSVARGAGSRCPADSGTDSTLNTFLFVLYVLAIVAVPTGAACLYARRVRKAAE